MTERRDFPWGIVILLASASALSYMDRQSLPVVVGELQKDIPLSDQQYAQLQMMFLLAYGLMYAGGGWLMDRLGTRLGYAVMITWWSVATFIHGLVHTATGLGLVRFLLGLGEGGGFPGSAKAVAETVPPKERSFAFGIFNTGSSVGAVIAPPLIAVIVLALGWRWVFFIFGVLGFIWAVTWWSLYRVPPAAAAPSFKIGDDLAGPRGAGLDIRWVDLFRYRKVWGLLLAKFMSDSAWYTGTLNGIRHYWIGNTSRDQYSGVFFGLAVAYELVDDIGIRSAATAVATRMLDFLMRNNWNIRMPDGRISTTFLIRPDQQLTLLQIGSRLNPGRFDSIYRTQRIFKAGLVIDPIAIEVLDDHNSYFKFNLNTINLYNLIRLEDSGYYRWWYDKAYELMRRTTDDHGNAHFNMIDRALRGANSIRDRNTREYLREWLLRPRRDSYIDLRGRYAACGTDKGCESIPIGERVATDFLWQRSPFLLFGGGDGRIEGAGIDYILPYWMARYYGVLAGGPQPPEVLTVAPGTGAGAEATFAFTFADSDGFQDLRVGLIVINGTLSGSNSCYIYYDRLSSSIWLANDTGDAWMGQERSEVRRDCRTANAAST